jgi:hypothetical protein
MLVRTTDAADYFQIVSEQTCSPKTSTTVTLTVNELVAITTQPVGQTVCSGKHGKYLMLLQQALDLPNGKKQEVILRELFYS